ncbi:hypothetical protein HDE_10902 [Halotydeus destructor]|nr:hypothetical protein HDE_10902 [Halotydeus destructor]
MSRSAEVEVDDSPQIEKNIYIDVIRQKLLIKDTDIAKEIIAFCHKNKVSERSLTEFVLLGGTIWNHPHIKSTARNATQYTNVLIEILPHLPEEWREETVRHVSRTRFPAFVHISGHRKILASCVAEPVTYALVKVFATHREKTYVFGLFGIDPETKEKKFEVLAPIVELGNTGSMTSRSLMGVVFEMDEVIDIMKCGVECSIQFTDAENPVVRTLAAHEMQQFRILIEKCDMAYIFAQYTSHATTYTACPEEGTYDCEFLSKID